MGDTLPVCLDNCRAGSDIGDDDIVHAGKKHPAGSNGLYLVNPARGNAENVVFDFGSAHAGNFNSLDDVYGNFVFKDNFAERAGRGSYRV